MQHPDLLHLGRMLDCAHAVLKHIEGMDREAFLSNATTIDAVAYRLQ